MKNPRDNIGTW